MSNGNQYAQVALYKNLLKIVVIVGFSALSACAPGGLSDSDDPKVTIEGGGEPDEQITFEGEERQSIEEIERAREENPVIENEPLSTQEERVAALAKYSHLDPKKVIPRYLLGSALVYFEKYKYRFSNQRYISMVDFRSYSGKKRFWVVNMSTGAVWSSYMAHGSGSDWDHNGYAERFSNVSGSKASSVGIYKTAETYEGKYGYSLRLDGLSSTNSNARARAVVVHGAYYVYDQAVKQGRSWGCLAVPMALRTTLINMIKGGSMIYSY